MEQSRTVTRSEGEKFAKENGLVFIETSAKTAQNVDEAFTGTARTILDKIKTGSIDPKTSPGIKIGQGPAYGGIELKPVGDQAGGSRCSC